MSDLARRLGRDQPGAWTELDELLRRDWAVRVLDAWQTANPDEHAFATYIAAHGDWRCASHSYYRQFNGPTPDAARIAAARAVYPELPEAVRQELGECP